MSMGDLSIFCSLQFLSSIIYGFFLLEVFQILCEVYS
jgi:hypothetical protein